MKLLTALSASRLLAIVVTAAAFCLLLHAQMFLLPKLPSPASSIRHQEMCERLQLDSRQKLFVDGLHHEARALRAALDGLATPLLLLTGLALVLQLMSLKRAQASATAAKLDEK